MSPKKRLEMHFFILLQLTEEMAQVAVVAGAAVAGAFAGKFLGGGKGSKDDFVFQVDSYQNYDHEKDIKKYIHLAQEWPEVRDTPPGGCDRLYIIRSPEDGFFLASAGVEMIA